MTERIDHAAEAQRIRSGAREILMAARGEMQPHMVAVLMLDDARLEAQLALVEQQRIANLIALAQMPVEDDENADYLAGRAMHALIEYQLSEATQFSDADEYPVVKDEIKEVLGL